ncbi:MAG TPA: TonB-dependent receptor, partial [Candidatus Omnitrophica bacterium]|nr:TonB-dependent receptor [Candidatus Omnitrophota bacterium]
IMGKIAFDQAVNSIWDHKISFSYSETERKYRDDPDSVDPTDNAHNWYKGDTKKFEWQHNFYPVDWSKTTAGFEYEEERGFSDGRASWNRFDRKTMDNKGYYLQNQFKLLETLFITPGLRVDDNEFFGRETTYKVSGSYLIPKMGTRFKANWGTGFKAPSLYQLYSSYGDPNLNPDKGKTYDFGFEQNLFNDRVTFGLTYFHNEFKSMVDFDMVSYTYQNIDNAKMKGLELEGSFKPTETLTIGANYTYTKTEDEDTGKELARRPKSQAGFNINWAFIEKANLNLSASYVGSRWNNSANTQKVKAYTKVDLYTSYDLTENFQIFGRIENLFDKASQQIHGYAAPGRSFYAGVKATF